MPQNTGIPPHWATDGPDKSPDLVFGEIHRIFCEMGMLNKDISLEYEGVRYRISCDDNLFMIYRINENSRLRHHVPGWPVCFVNSETIFEEASSPGLATDHYSCRLDIEKWIELIGKCVQDDCSL